MREGVHALVSRSFTSRCAEPGDIGKDGIWSSLQGPLRGPMDRWQFWWGLTVGGTGLTIEGKKYINQMTPSALYMFV